MGTLAVYESIEQLDARLVSLAREEAGLHLRLGQVLELMQRRACCFELGFSSLAAYALERCERGARWVEAACCLARRLEALPLLRAAIAMGRISWSMAELLARVAQPQGEAHWLELAQHRTVRQMRAEVSARREAVAAEQESMATLTVTVDREEAWLLEATRALLEQLGTCGAEEQLEALLAEGQGALLAALPGEALALEGFEAADGAQRRWREQLAQWHWREQLAQWRDEAERRCEPHIRAKVLEREASAGSMALQAAPGVRPLEGLNSRELDAVVRELAPALARQELQLSQLLWRFHRADGWRRLGYATETQYARERLGLSRSSVIARRSLALRLEVLPNIASALGRAEIGVEAALQVVRIATPNTELAWLERARLRTVKHLREEVAASLAAVRLSGELDCAPPEPAELDGFQELERAVLSGRVWGGTPNRPQRGCCHEPAAEPLAAASHASARRPWRAMLTSLSAWLEQGALEHAVQMSADTNVGGRRKQPRGAGRVKFRWRVSLELRSWWRALEECARRWLPRGMSWVRFLCLVFWKAWSHMVGLNVAWGQVYLRDRCRCSSPVCGRRDVTPHHLRFRSAGGGDEDANMASLCTWCHLFGVHEGRIRATGRAGHVVWELPCLRVEGRERVRN